MMIVPEAANMPPTPWQTEILTPGIMARAGKSDGSGQAGFAPKSPTIGQAITEKQRVKFGRLHDLIAG
jgi:hypothetical protein